MGMLNFSHFCLHPRFKMQGERPNEPLGKNTSDLSLPRIVDPDKTLEEAEIEDGDCLTALVLQPQLAAANGAFALWCHGDSTLVTWRHADFGGDSSAVRDQLRGVQQIQATSRAFAAILENGSVVTWGHADFGGDSSGVRDELRGVQQIQATDGAFAAILEDGSCRYLGCWTL